MLDKLSGKKLSDYKAQISATKRKLKVDLEAIPTRIDEAENAKPEDQDFELIENEISVRETKLSEIDKSLSDQNKAQNQVVKFNQQIFENINDLKLQQQNIISKKQQELYDADAKNRNEKRELEDKIRQSEYSFQSEQNRQKNNIDKIESIERTLSELRNKFDEEFNKVYQAQTGKLICPVWNITCGDPKSLELHQENQDKARQTFNAKKAEKLAQINSEGKRLNEEKAKIEEENADVAIDLEKLKEEKAALEKRLVIFPKEDAKVRQINPSTLPEWNALQKQIDDLEKSVKTTPLADNTAVLEQKKTLNAEIKNLQNILANKTIIDNQNKRIAQLNEELKKVAHQISDLEKDEFLIEAFTKAKIDEAENRINSRFSFVKFKLFERQINGADVETCQAMVNGVPYSDVNTASKINAGIDIINVLCDFNDVTAPIWLDNRESVSEIIPTEGQIINLIVNPEFKKLTLKIN